MTSLPGFETTAISPVEPKTPISGAPLFVYLMADETTLPSTALLPEGVTFIAAGAVPAAMVSDSAASLAQAAAMWHGHAKGTEQTTQAKQTTPTGRQAPTLPSASTQMAYAWPIASAHVVEASVTVTREMSGVIRIDLAATDTDRLIAALVQASGLPSETFVVHVASGDSGKASSKRHDPASNASSHGLNGAGDSSRYGSHGNIAAAVAGVMCLLSTGRPIAMQGWIFNAASEMDIDTPDGIHADSPYAFMQMSASLDAHAHIHTLQGVVSRQKNAVDGAFASSSASAINATDASAAPPACEPAFEPASKPNFEFASEPDAHPVYRIEQTHIQTDDPFALIPSAAKTFARESFLDELSEQAGCDPIAYRLAHLDALRDAGARELISTLADRAAWQGHREVAGRDGGDANRFPPSEVAARKPSKTFAEGRGFAFDTVGKPAAYSAWIVDIEVNKRSGEIDVRRVVAGQASGQPGARIDGLPADQIAASVAAMIAPASAQSATLPLNAQASADDTVDATGRALSYDLGTRAVVAHNAEVAVRLDKAADGPGIGMSSADFMAPAAAAIANALFDATGVRFRAPPFSPERVRNALAGKTTQTAGAVDIGAAVVAPVEQKSADAVSREGQSTQASFIDESPSAQSYGQRQAKRRKTSARTWLTMAGLGGVIGIAASLWPTRAPIEKIARPDLSTYSAETIERGRLIANTGDCAVCHTAAGGAVNAGGLGLDTPFGKVYSTNLTPDVDTGIGGWSYDAFARAMREGISRDGRHLYPAFPYTAFAKISEADMTALYAYLMSQPAVSSTPPETKLPFPFNQRYLMAGWNALYLKQGAYAPDRKRSAEWNRGAYLVEGLGHCSACHSPRNALGAERNGPAYMSGGTVDGWIAPSLTAGSRAPVQWTEAALYQYLSTGFSPEHGVAAGPMAPVVSGLSTLPASDVRAIANYIASLNPVAPVPGAKDEAKAEVVPPQTVESAVRVAALDGDALQQGLDSGKRIFDTACAVCHAATGGVGNFGVRPLLSLNTSVSESTPDNLLRIIQDGITEPATDALGYMPGFKGALDDQQIADLTYYIRARFAPGQAAWTDVAARSAAVRNGVH